MSEIIRYEQQDALATLPLDRFDELLQQGQIAEALDLRMDAIESSAREHRTDCEAAKFSAAGLAVAGLLMSASPVIGLLGGLGAVAYGVTLFQDYQKTKRFCPIPAVRKTLPELLTGVGDAADRRDTQQADDPLADVLAFVEPPVAHEYELLQVRELEMQRYLQRFPPGKRLLAYRVALRQTRLRGTLSLPSVQQAATMDQELQPDTAPIEYADYSSAQEPAPTDAIDVPATEIQRPSAQPEPPQAVAPDSRPPTPSHPSPVSYLIGDRLRTALIVSVSGGGKDILLSNALRVFLSHCPDFRVVVADCKDDPKEYGYYADLPNVSVHRLNVAIASDGEVIQWVDTWVSEFIQLPEQALLICNEGFLVRDKSERYVQVISGLVSSGDSRQKYCWEAGQSAHAIDLKISGAARSRFRVLIIGLKSEEMQIEAVLSAKFVADSARNMDDIKMQMLRSPVSRAWSDGQQWFAMPKLENYSGYDRDSRSMLAGSVAPQPPQDIRAQLEELLGTTGNEIGNDAGNDGNGNEISSPNSGTKSDDGERTGTTQERDFQPIHLDSGTFLERFPGTTEATVFAQILDGYGNGFAPSDIVKRSLGLNKRYAEGKAACCYLVRKYGNAALFAHFEKWLEEGQHS